MNFQVSIDIPAIGQKIRHSDRIYLIGSCFTEHIANYLRKAKFEVLSNAHGILFNPFSVYQSMSDVVHKTRYEPKDLFFLNEQWNSWYHHSDFSVVGQSEPEAQACAKNINETIQQHHDFVKEAQYVIITLGSAFAYWHIEEEHYVSNNHRAPSQRFRKDLLSIEAIQEYLRKIEQDIHLLNPNARIIYTISPVRHLRDGVVENNRSKARLLEAVHSREQAYYFPAYELVIDVLRDYRFYDIDMAHPNFAATSYVWEQFVSHCIHPDDTELMKQCEQLSKAMSHRPKSTHTEAHRNFLKQHLELCITLKAAHPYLDLEKEMAYFDYK